MINRIKKSLQNENYRFIEEENLIQIFYGIGCKYPEDYIIIKKCEDYIELLEVHRDEEKIIIKSNDENFVIITVIVLCKRIFEAPSNDAIVVRELRSEVSNGNIERANKILDENLNSNFFSINEENTGKIIMLNCGEKVHIKFQDKFIVENAILSRGYVVLYNYAKLLMEFEKIFKQLSEEFNTQNKYQNLATLYIIGTI